MASASLGLDEKIDFGNLELLAQQVVEGFITGLHKSPFHGFSVEFAEHRLYNTGNSIKNIDWKLFARTEKLFVKRFEEETNLRCHILIDNSSSMFYPLTGINKFEFSALAAAALINLLKKQRDAFGLSVFGEKIELHTPAKSTTSHQKFILNELTQFLKNQQKNTKTNLIESLHLIAEQIHKRSLVVLFTDMFDTVSSENYLDDVFAALQHLKFAKNEVIIFNINERKHELDFNFENRPYHFIDLESNDAIKINPIQFKETYLNKVTQFKSTLALKCAQYKIDLINADLEEGFYPILKAWLLKRNKMM
ncbi:DUF58 domain-containing protein [Pedobacter alpinus]|uniref:DUF58 domain-containing protein n=1 Tax=Pedobacter alpinus TaxID=1590643 RepID=A0ABW5TUE7_9SPHI